MNMYVKSLDHNKLIYDSSSASACDPSIPEKVECVGHVQKRMGTRLRKLKTQYGSRTLSDGNPMGGRGRLTLKMIDYLQVMYGNAIRGNKHQLADMWKAIWAIYHHEISTD